MFPENIHTHSMEGHWKFWRGGSQQPKLIRESVKFNWKFQRGGFKWKKKKNHPRWRYGYFLEPHIFMYRFYLWCHVWSQIQIFCVFNLFRYFPSKTLIVIKPATTMEFFSIQVTISMTTDIFSSLVLPYEHCMILLAYLNEITSPPSIFIDWWCIIFMVFLPF